MSTADTAAACITGQAQAAQLLDQLGAGHAPPDLLHTRLQELRALGCGATLRSYTRTIQKSLERAAQQGGAA